jgi:hypothetical protein
MALRKRASLLVWRVVLCAAGATQAPLASFLSPRDDTQCVCVCAGRAAQRSTATVPPLFAGLWLSVRTRRKKRVPAAADAARTKHQTGKSWHSTNDITS